MPLALSDYFPKPLRRARLALLALALVLSTQAARAEPTKSTWRERYVAARELLVRGQDDAAARAFAELAAQAENPEDRRLAEEFATLARLKHAPPQAPPPALRRADEMSLLYSAALLYGLGTSAWVGLVTKPRSLGAAALPFAAITTASVAAVALSDQNRPFRRGVPQSISVGLFLGFGEGIWAVGIQHARASRRDDGSRWHSETVATVLWSGATLGGVAGGVVGAFRQPTPGRVSFTASSTLWGGLLGAFGAAAVEPSAEQRTQTALMVGAIGYNAGLIGGVIAAPVIAPSVSRVRITDLGGLGGGLIGAGTYGLFAGNASKTQLSLGATAIGAAAGLGVTWWATRDMLGDPPKASPALPSAWLPFVTRAGDGWLAGVSGDL
jgi:hypothetical protein